MSAVGVLGASESQRDGTTATLGDMALRAVVVTDRAGLDALAAQWLALEEAADGLTLFQSLGWARAVWDFEERRGNAAFRPVIAVLQQGGRTLGILPLELIVTRTRRVLSPLGHAFGQYADMLMAQGAEPVRVLASLLKAAIGAAPCDAVSFLKVRDGSALARGMPASHVTTGTVEGAPYVDLSGFADHAAYFATIKAKTRKNMRNARNRLEREGVVDHHVAVDGPEMLGVIERTLNGRADRLKEQGLTSRAFRDSGFADFCKSLVSRTDLELMGLSLRHQGQPIAEQWGFVHGGRYYAFVATRDFSNSDESPGKLHLGEVIRAGAERGLGGCDLGVPVMPYKLTWATKTVPVRDYALPVTPRGHLVIRLWDVWLRPMLKGALLRLPSGLRGRLLKAAGHGH